MLSIEEIQNILPQRFPFLMIDRVIELDPGKKVVAIKNVSMNEQFFSGHFPGKPVMPGVLITEAMAQTAIVLFASGKNTAQDKKMSYYLGSIKMRFLHPVSPGDQLKITVEPIKMLSNIAIVSAYAEASGKEVARGELSLSAKEG
ncbi:MAG: 3-hydroxyacyl-ACP dehydratase FabZ [Candidatus Omnitrophica bacterium]|jgi:3-hydroxyacyl-[acyl-carrier-protein] dehydratase|nr:3-hydroxyacyl-ACP dehydratase FabZ [Candidatus Omnitrophota bacterium]